MLILSDCRRCRIIPQRSLPALTPELRGIRLDVEIEELHDPAERLPVMSVYDLEPHLQNNVNMPRHNRFYQARIDSRYLRSGERSFSKLPDLYVLTITSYDPFGQDYMLYTISNRCEELPDMDYGDGLKFLYFNTGGKKGGTPQIAAMLKYLQHSTEENVANEAIREIHRYVTDVKIRPEVKKEYMTFEEFIEYKEIAAAEEASRRTERETMVQAIMDLLEDYGAVPEEVGERLKKEEPSALKRWHKIAAKSKSLEEFTDYLNRET